MAYPYVAVFAMLLGMPAAVRMTSSYILQMTTDVQAEI
jgi:hypothetical protein